MTLPSNEAEARRQEALDDVSRALRVLTANLIRVTRGAGSPFDISFQASAFLEAFTAYGTATGRVVRPDELAAMLRRGSEYREPPQPDADQRSEAGAAHQALRASLQIAASRLVDQDQEERKGERDLLEALRTGARYQAEKAKREEAERAREHVARILSRPPRKPRRKPE